MSDNRIINQKVFVIGLHKTGTTSLGRALALLGYRVKGYVDLEKIQNIDKVCVEAFAIIDRNEHDAFEDNPWPVLFREIDKRYPNSKFILTVRPDQEWLNSVKKHFDYRPARAMEWIYGFDSPLGNEEQYLSFYRNHNAEVQAYFATRTESLLIMDTDSGFGWSRLCEFLSKPIPSIEFPHLNTAREREGSLLRRLARYILRLVRR